MPSLADDTQHRGDAVHGLEVVQVADGGLDIGLAGDVGDEGEPRLVAESLLLHRPDGHAVGAEDAGDGGQDAGSIEDVEVEVVGALDLVDRAQAGPAERADAGVAAAGAGYSGVR